MEKIKISDIVIPEGRRTLRSVQELADSIKEIGLLNPVTIREDNTLVAGYHRIEACKLLGMTEIEAIKVGLSDLEAELAEIDENLVRNELTELEKSEHLARRKRVYEALHPEAKPYSTEKQRQRRSQKPSETVSPGFTTDTAAKTGVSRRSVQQGVQVAEKIVPEVRDAIRETPLADSKRDLLDLARLVPEVQKPVVEKIVSGEAKNVKEAVKKVELDNTEQARTKVTTLPITERYKIIHDDISDAIFQVGNNTVDFVITDPPYPREYLPLYETLAKESARVLKPGGSLLVMVGQSYLPEVISIITKYLKYHWVLSYLTPGGQAVQLWDRKVNTFWKPVFWFVNGDYENGWIGDVVKSAVNDNDKRFHDWGQSESGISDLLTRFIRPGQTILDPFLGGGTIGVVALKHGCYFIGIDKDKRSIDTALSRLGGIISA